MRRTSCLRVLAAAQHDTGRAVPERHRSSCNGGGRRVRSSHPKNNHGVRNDRPGVGVVDRTVGRLHRLRRWRMRVPATPRPRSAKPCSLRWRPPRAALPGAPEGWIIGGYEGEHSVTQNLCLEAEATPWSYGVSRTLNRADDAADASERSPSVGVPPRGATGPSAPHRCVDGPGRGARCRARPRSATRRPSAHRRHQPRDGAAAAGVRAADVARRRSGAHRGARPQRRWRTAA